MTKIWPVVSLKTDYGDKKAIAPWIISASRATDISAFYSRWFFNRLEKGYFKWVNPYNRAMSEYVSFENTKVVVFWSKNPEPVIPYLGYLEKKNIAFYFLYTLNDYENEGFEPHVPPLEKRVETFRKISAMYGKERVIWRFDPLILTDRVSPDLLVEKIRKVGEYLHPYTEKLVFSFADIDMYRKVRSSFIKKGILYRTFNTEIIEYVAEKISGINRNWGLEVVTCSETADLEKFGIFHNRCIDDKLILRITDNESRDPAFEKFLGYNRHEKHQLDLSGVPVKEKNKNMKDKGQRKECGCIYSKDTGSYNTCPHGCIYCYAGSLSSLRRTFDDGDALAI